MPVPGKIGGKEELMNYQVLDVKVKDTEETGKLYTYFLDNSREIAPERVRPVIVICRAAVMNGCPSVRQSRLR